MKVHKVEEQIPKELWLKVLGYLPNPDIFKSVSLVSKFFNNLTMDPYLIKVLKIGVVTKHNFQNVQALLKRCRDLMKVEFKDFSNAIALKLIPILLERNKNLKELILLQDNDTLVDFDTSTICELGKNIEKLEIEPKESLTGKHLAKMPNLKVLKTDLKIPDALFHLAQGCKKLQHLEFTCLDFQDAENDTLKAAFKMFFENVQQNLKFFSIALYEDDEDEHDSKDKFKDCFEYLSLCQNLEEIVIMEMPLSSKDMIFLTKLPNLKKLSISPMKCPIDFNSLFAKIRKQNLVELNIQHVFDESFTQDVLIELTKNGGCPNLTKLGLDGNRCFTVTTKLLKAFIDNCPKLIHIIMNGYVRKNICPQYLDELRIEGRVQLHPSSNDAIPEQFKSDGYGYLVPFQEEV